MSKKKEIKVNDLGFEVGIEINYKNIRARVLLLERRLIAGEYGKEGSKLFIKAMRNYNQYSTMLNFMLREQGKKPRKKKFAPKKPFATMYGPNAKKKKSAGSDRLPFFIIRSGA